MHSYKSLNFNLFIVVGFIVCAWHCEWGRILLGLR